MTGVRTLPKPRLVPIRSGWAEPLGEEIRAQLREILTKEASASTQQAEAFLDACGSVAFSANASRTDSGNAGKGFEDLAKRAHDLQIALRKLTASEILALDTHARALAWSAEPSAPIAALSRGTDGFLSGVWEVAQALEGISNQAAQELQQLKRETKGRHRAGEAVARFIAQEVTRLFVHHFGRVPPGHQHSWFVQFMELLAGSAGVTCGPKPVEAAVAKAKAEFCAGAAK